MPDKLLHALHLCIPFHHKKEMSTHKKQTFHNLKTSLSVPRTYRWFYENAFFGSYSLTFSRFPGLHIIALPHLLTLYAQWHTRGITPCLQ